MSEQGEVQAQLLGVAIRKASDRHLEKKATEETDRGGDHGSNRSRSRPDEKIPRKTWGSL